ncbi:MAG: hypothetical protein WDN08_14150 [Rhizomicrobium sp.]
MTALALLGLIAPLGGCASRGAPSFILFGAYFPGWMFCALLGVLGGIGARVAMALSGLSDVLPFQLFVCVSAGFIVAAAAWLLWFGR